MNTRRLPLLLLLVLIPVPAQGDDHKMEAGFGLSPGSLALRFSVGRLLWETGEPRERSLFVVAEVDKYVVGRDSGDARDGGMIGLRYFPLGHRTIEPFFHSMVGLQHSSRRNDVTAGDDAASDWSGTAAVGLGVDINPSEAAGIVPVIRLQLDAVESGVTAGFDPYVRATVGVSFRFEGSHK